MDNPLFEVKLYTKGGHLVVLNNLVKFDYEGGTLKWKYHEDHDGPLLFSPLFLIENVECCTYQVQKEFMKFN